MPVLCVFNLAVTFDYQPCNLLKALQLSGLCNHDRKPTGQNSCSLAFHAAFLLYIILIINFGKLNRIKFDSSPTFYSYWIGKKLELLNHQAHT